MIKLRKLLACLMIVCMAFSLMPLAAFAAEGETEDAGVCEQHSFDNGVCTACGYECPHDNVTDGVCAVCGMAVGEENNNSEPNGVVVNEIPAASIANDIENEETDYAAQIGENSYGTIDEALDAMQPGDTVTLLKDVEGDVTLATDGTIDLNGCDIAGTVTIQANITLQGGSVSQSLSQAAVIIEKGSLKLDGTKIINTGAGDTGNGILVDSTEEVKIEVAGFISVEGYGIKQNKKDGQETGSLSVTSCPGSSITGGICGVYIENGSYTADTTAQTDEMVEVYSNDAAIEIHNGSINISGSNGAFYGQIIIAEGVTNAITGGAFYNKPSVAEGYVAKKDGVLYYVVPGHKIGNVTVAVDVKESSAAVTADAGITAPDGSAGVMGVSDAIKAEELLKASSLQLQNGDTVAIEIVPVVNVKAVDGAASAVYSISLKANVSINGSEPAEIPVADNMLNGGEITVTVPLVSGFAPEEIVHTHAVRSEDIYKKGSAASLTEFVVNGDGTVSFKVKAFSDFTMYAQATIAEVYKADGSLKAKCRSDEEILSNIEDGCTVKLLNDLTGASLHNVDLKKNSVTLELAGHKLTGADGVYALDIAGGSLTIMDSSAAGTGEISGTPAVRVGPGATVTLASGKLTGTGYGVEVNGAGAKFVMENGAVSGTDKAVYVELGGTEIAGGMIDGVSEDVGVKSAALEDVKVSISGGSFANPVPPVQCKAGYVPTGPDGSGRYGVEPLNEPVAMAQNALGVDKGKFATVQDAVNAAGFGGKVTLLRDSGDYANVSGIKVFDGAGCRMKSLTVQSTTTVKVMNLRADVITVSANAQAEISSGRYLTHTGSGTYSISGGVFGDEVTQEQCALVPVTGKLTGTAESLTKYVPAQNTDPETKDAYPYTVAVAPVPSITEISDNAYFQKYSSGTLTIYTDGDYDELVKSGTIYRCLHVYNANGTDLISSRYYTVEEDANGYAVITISNSFLRNRPTGTYSVQVDFTTGVTQLEDFRVGTSSTPKTGDESNIGLWIGIMACSAIIIGCGVFVLIHKNRKNKK